MQSVRALGAESKTAEAPSKCSPYLGVEVLICSLGLRFFPDLGLLGMGPSICRLQHFTLNLGSDWGQT